MNVMFMILILIGSMNITAYRSTPKQCRAKHYTWTASGVRCNVHGCAVSRDLLKKNGGSLEFGDMIYIPGIGIKFIEDTMNARHKQSIDIWVETFKDEKKFDETWKGKKVAVYRIKGGK